MESAARSNAFPPRGAHRVIGSLVAFLTGLMGFGCEAPPPDVARAGWQAWALRVDHDALLARDAAAVGEKYALMASSAWRYFRGTAPLFWRDVLEAGTREACQADGGCAPLPPWPTAGRAAGAEAVSRIWLVGDAHVENVGSLITRDGDVTLGFNDFDAARPGPWVLDVLRLATSLGLLVHPEALPDGGAGAAAGLPVAEALGASYAAHVALLAEGAALSPIRGATPGLRGGVIAEDLLRRALRDRDEAAVPEAWTRASAGGAPVLVRGAVEDADLPGLAPEGGVEAPERARLEVAVALIGAWAGAAGAVTADPEALRARTELGDGVAGGRLVVEDLVRRLGTGVASRPLLRFIALVRLGEAPEAPRMLLDLKEAWDPPRPGDLRVLLPRFVVNNAERIAHARNLLGEPAAADPLNLPLSVGALRLRAMSFCSAERNLSVRRIRERLRSGDFAPAAVEELARVLGRLLAEAHVRSEAVDHGRPVGPLIAAALARHEADFPAEVAAFVAAAVPLALADHRRFAALLAADVDPRRLGASASDAPWRSP